jgi:hypothetical protein
VIAQHRRRIRRDLVGAGIALLLLLAGCADSITPNVRRVPATIRFEDGRYVLVNDSTKVRYIPDRIPLSYREDGLAVFVTGRIADPESDTGTDEVAIEVTSLSQRTE